MDSKIKKMKELITEILKESNFNLTEEHLYGFARSMVIPQSISTEDLLKKKKSIQTHLNEVSALAEKGDVAAVEEYITKANLSGDEFAGALYFEAINMGVIRGSKEFKCSQAFATKYPALVEKIAKDHPDYFLDGAIVKAVKSVVSAPIQKTIDSIKCITRETPIRLLLNFDINGTLILMDSAKKSTTDQMIQSALADSTYYKWDPNSEKPIPFRTYVDNVLVTGDKSSAEVKNKRREIAYNFVQWLKDHKHPLYEQVAQDFKTIHDKIAGPNAKVGESAVFVSFYVLLKKLRDMKINFSIILRTFGSDSPSVVAQLKDHPEGIKIPEKNYGKYSGQTLTFPDGVRNEKEAFLYYLKSNEHFAVQDDWKHWNSNGEKGCSGKTFLYDPNQNFEGIPNVSLFFDDNITGEEYDIVRPVDVNGPTEHPSKELFEQLLIPVLAKEAMLDDNYFVKKITPILDQIKKKK